MALQNNGFNFSGNATCVINQAPEKGNYDYGTVKPHNRLSAIDANYAHLTGITAMASSIISDPEYENDKHLLSLVQAISLNASIALDMLKGITAQ